MPLSATISRSFGAKAREPLAGFERNREIAQIAVVDPEQPRLQRQGALDFGLVMGLGEDIHVQVMGGGVSAWASRSLTQAMMMRMQSAPAARAS